MVPNWILLLFGVQRLLGIVHCGLGGGHTGAVLFDSELCVANFDTDLVLLLLQTHLGLLELKLRADLRGLRGTITEWNVELQANAFVRRRRVDELVQGAAVAGGGGGRDEGLPTESCRLGPEQKPSLCSVRGSFAQRFAGFCDPPKPEPP